MIVGKGLIASQFNDWWKDKDVVIFASGVSNSKEGKHSEYQREKQLIETFFSSNKLFVYFSTCSIFDKNLENSLYIKHKLQIEELIKNNFTNYFILRLPNVIGETKNQNTFFNYFYNAIVNQNEIQIQKNNIRYFLDVEKIEPMVKYIYNNRSDWNKTINMIFDDPISILKVLLIMEKAIGLVAKKRIVDGGMKYTISNKSFSKYKSKIFHNINDEGYTEMVIKKYVKLINNAL